MKQNKIPFLTQVKVVLTDKYFLILFGYFLISTVGTTLKNMSLVYYCNYVLGTYNDGTTQMLISVIGGVPMGIGIFAVWPLAKKFGKRNVTMWGFVLYAVGSAICWTMPTNMIIVLIGQFIKNIGGLPCAYVFMALFSDGLDHLEWKTGLRCDGVANSLNGIITVVLSGVCAGIFNALLSATGYLAPPEGVVSGTAIVQPQAVLDVITFCFVGLEVITGAVLAGLLIFLSVEKTIGRKQAIIRERQKAACLARGEEWQEPEVRAALEQARLDEEAEEAFRKELFAKCEKKGTDYQAALAEHEAQVAAAKAKAEEKARAAEEKAAAKAERIAKKRAEKLAKLTPAQRESKEKRAAQKAEREESAWKIESQKGEAYYQKIQAELAASK